MIDGESSELTENDAVMCKKMQVRNRKTGVLYSYSVINYATMTTTTTTGLWPFFRDHLGQPVLEENFWTLWYKGKLTEAETPTIQQHVTLSGLISAHLHHLPIFFYGPDALPAAQPTVSKH